MSVLVTRGNNDDRTRLVDMCKGLIGMIFGDKGYVSKAKTESLAKQGLKLITSLKKNMKNVFRSRQEKDFI